MNNKVIINILRFIGLVLSQILVIDNIRFGRYIHPYVYVLFVMLLPTKMSNSLVMMIGFLTGLVIDIFAGTPGLNAAATTFMAFVRPLVINSMFVGDDIKNIGEPSPIEMGKGRFATYMLILLLAHNLILFLLEAFSFRLFGIILIQTLLGVATSAVFITIIVSVFTQKRKKVLR